MPEPDLALPETPESAAALTAEPARLGNWWRWAVVIAYFATIYFLSSRSTLPPMPKFLTDKMLHFGAYAVMGALVLWAMTHGEWKRTTISAVLATALLCTAYGLSDEFHQLFVPGRSFDFKDLLADAGGALTAASALWACGIIARGKEPSNDV